MNMVRQELHDVGIRILEDWAMMLVEPEEGALDVFDPEESFYIAQLRFKGIVSGRYCIICQAPFARSLSVNLLGESNQAGEPEMLDALKEMVNVVSGNMLTSSYGEETTFDLTAPEARSATIEEVRELFNQFILCFRGDDEPIAVTFIPEQVHHD